MLSPDYTPKVGDVLELRWDQWRPLCCSVGSIFTVSEIDNLDTVRLESRDDPSHVYHWDNFRAIRENFKLVEENIGDNMSTTSKKIQELNLSEEDRLLRKYGLEDENGKRTSEGQTVMADLLWTEKRDEIVATLKKIEAQETASKK